MRTPLPETKHQRTGCCQRLGAVLTLLVALQSECHVGCAARHMGCIQHPALECNRVGGTRTCSQAPAETCHPELWSLKAFANGRDLTDEYQKEKTRLPVTSRGEMCGPCTKQHKLTPE